MRMKTEIEIIYELNKLYAERKKVLDKGWHNIDYDSRIFDKIDEVEDKLQRHRDYTALVSKTWIVQLR